MPVLVQRLVVAGLALTTLCLLSATAAAGLCTAALLQALAQLPPAHAAAQVDVPAPPLTAAGTPPDPAPARSSTSAPEATAAPAVLPRGRARARAQIETSRPDGDAPMPHPRALRDTLSAADPELAALVDDPDPDVRRAIGAFFVDDGPRDIAP